MTDTMTDRELLEAAAEAAGIRYDPEASKPHPKSGAWFGLWLLIDGEPNDLTRRRWNPLTDDGDAFRLAVKLWLEVTQVHGQAHAGMRGKFWCTESWFPDSDPYAATRRAIVRAAAALTRMESKEE